MMDELYTNNELPISATEGWRQMQFLLDEKLPMKSGMRKISIVRSIASFVIFSFIFIISSIKLSDGIMKQHLQLPVTGSVNTVTKAGSNTTIAAIVENKMKTPVVSLDPTHDKPAFFTDAIVTNNYTYPERVNGIFEVNGFNDFDKVLSLPKMKLTQLKDQIIGEKIKVKEKNQSPHWQLAAGAGVNAVEGRQQNFQPFPVAEISYHLNNKFYIASGVSAPVPVAGDISGTIRTVYVNDTANDISMYKEVAKYSQLKYVNIPLLAGVNISNKFSVQAGLQLSILMSRKYTTDLKPYDFRMNDVYPATIPPPLIGMAAPSQDAVVNPRSVNYQLTAGIKYKVNKVSLGLMYQQALQSPGIGNTNSSAGKRLFTFNVLYNLK